MRLNLQCMPTRVKRRCWVVECAYLASQVTEFPFLASKVRFSLNEAEEVFQLGPLSEYERIGLEKVKKELAGSIQKGISFIKK